MNFDNRDREGDGNEVAEQWRSKPKPLPPPVALPEVPVPVKKRPYKRRLVLEPPSHGTGETVRVEPDR